MKKLLVVSVLSLLAAAPAGANEMVSMSLSMGGQFCPDTPVPPPHGPVEIGCAVMGGIFSPTLIELIPSNSDHSNLHQAAGRWTESRNIFGQDFMAIVNVVKYGDDHGLSLYYLDGILADQQGHTVGASSSFNSMGEIHGITLRGTSVATQGGHVTPTLYMGPAPEPLPSLSPGPIPSARPFPMPSTVPSPWPTPVPSSLPSPLPIPGPSASP